ncbi:MAG: hypothetical protein KY391_02955 [Actinobacteria bacterium]|nr:hypothetical protein [Actinomycetota bacterium]
MASSRSQTIDRVRERALELGVYLPLGAYSAVRDEIVDIDATRIRKLYEGLVDRGQSRVDDAQKVLKVRTRGIRRQAKDTADDVESTTRKASKRASVAANNIAPKLPRVAAPKNASELPIEGYNSMTASEIVTRLKGLTQTELAKVYKYEQANEGRATILDAIDSKLIVLPITTYDALTVDEIATRLERLSEDELKTIRRYEADTKARAGVLDKIDSLLSV